MICRVLPFSLGAGPDNMAWDETLLETAETGSAVFRTYGWSRPTLSLGYFQRLADAESDPRWRDAPVVRRPTGGGALWHDRELTYALALPRSHPLSRRHVDLYEAVHEAIASGLRAIHLTAARRGTTEPSSQRPFLCFLDCDASDVIVGPSKVVGSAQRRRSGAILQHGSLLLARSPRTPELPGLEELGLSRAQDVLGPGRIGDLILTACGLTAQEGLPTDEERRRAQELQAKYREPTWTGRR